MRRRQPKPIQNFAGIDHFRPTFVSVGFFLRNQSVYNAYRAMRKRGDLRVMRHEDDRDPLGIELLEHPQNLDARL